MTEMTDSQFEAHIRTSIRRRVGDASVPSGLRYAVFAIPDAQPAPTDMPGSRRLLIVLAVGMLMILAASGVIAVGSGLIRLPWPDVSDPDGGATTIFRDLGLASVTVSSSDHGGDVGGEELIAELGVVPQSDGSILVARITGASLVLTRLDALGRIDGTFGADGRMQVRHGWDPIVRAFATQADGSVVVLSEEGLGQFVITKYLADGEVDARFGDGAVNFRQSGEGTAIGAAIQPDGRVVIAGSSGMGGGRPDAVQFVLRRFNTNGTSDASFGGGEVRHQLSSGQDPVGGLLIQSDGRILVVGSTGWMTPGGADNDIALVAWLPDGTIDDSFGSANGAIQLHVPGTGANYGRAVAQQAGERLIVLGSVAETSRPALARIFPDGRLDSSFGNAGFVTLPALEGPAFLATQPDGKILVGSNSRLLRFNPDGSADVDFGDGGAVSLP